MLAHIRVCCFLAPIAFYLIAVLAADVRGGPIAYGSNLIDNPGAELGIPLGGPSTNLSSWIVTVGPIGANGFSGYSWTAGAGLPVYADPGPMPTVTRGNNFFYGGDDSPLSSAHQTMAGATPVIQSDIDAGLVTYDVNGWFGGYFTHDDNARLVLTFFDGIGTNLGIVTLGPVLAVDRGDVTGLLFRQGKGTVPVGTRTLDVTLTFTRFLGLHNDGYIENLSLVLTGPLPPPPPPVVPPTPAGGGLNEGDYPGSKGLVNGPGGEGTFGFGRQKKMLQPRFKGPHRDPVGILRVFNVAHQPRTQDSDANNEIGVLGWGAMLLAAFAAAAIVVGRRRPA